MEDSEIVAQVTRKSFLGAPGWRFAMVTVGRPRRPGGHPAPEVLLNGYDWTEFHPEVVEAAQRGIREAERELDWDGIEHGVLTVEGLLVDGINLEAAHRAAAEATRELIQGASDEST